MDRQQAEQALSIIRGVIENTREDLVEHNWGQIWLVHAFTNAMAFVSIGIFVEQQNRSLVWYLVPLAIVAPINLLVIALLSNRNRGTRSYVEWQVHGIWSVFIIVTIAVAAVAHLSDARPTMFCPLLALTSAFGFAMMGVVFYRRFFVVAIVFLILAILVSLSPVQPLQWYLLAAAWWFAMFAPGVVLHRERRRRDRGDRETSIL